MTSLDNRIQPAATEYVTATSARRNRQADVSLLLLLVLLVGAYFRFLNVDWDEGEHLHPDERYITMTTGAIRSPDSASSTQPPPAGCDTWGGYFDSYCSPLNPYNHQGFGSYAYGTLPLFSARLVGEWLSDACLDPNNPSDTPSAPQRWIAALLFKDADGCVGDRFTDYGHVHILGRMLSALVDLGTLLLTFFIGRRLYGPWVGLLGAALYALAALPIQQSHFYTVDAFAGFFIAGAGYFAVRGAQTGGWGSFLLSGTAFGFALASKVSVWPFAAVIALAALLTYVRSRSATLTPKPVEPDPGGASLTPLPPEVGTDLLSRTSGLPAPPQGQASPARTAAQAHTPRGRGRVLDALMVLLALIFTALIASIALLGIWSAVKITFFFAVGLLFVAGLLFYVLRPGLDGPSAGVSRGGGRGISLDAALLRLLLAGLFAFIAFRAAQPYAFLGTNFDNQWQAPEYDWLRANVPDLWYTLNDNLPAPLRALLLPDPRFIGTLGSVNKQLTGEADVPWGHQWTNRLPFVFPWVNMVVWGMGIPLGLTVWLAWGVAAWELWRGKRRMDHFIPWAWATILFFYQGTQWVKSIRYLLPTYPFLILLGAWLLVRLWRQARDRVQEGTSRRLLSGLHRVPLALILVATALWAWGFTRIYAQPVTRNAASRWMFENIPTAATLHYQADGQARTRFLQMPSSYTYAEDGVSQLSAFVMPEDGVVTGITFTHLGDPERDAAPEHFNVVLAADAGGQDVVAEAERDIHMEQARHALGDAQRFDLEPQPLDGGREYYLITQAAAGAPVELNTTVIANEYPDDSLPTRVDGRDPFARMYRGLQTSGDGKTHWDLNEGPDKLSQALEWLDEADIIALSSNRGYASIPRLPSRYPLAIEYYRALFAEELGFELIATFASYPTIGPFQFPDQETPFPPGNPSLIRQESGSISVPLPPAEEAFSVYDHPQVFLFQKTDDYSRQRVEQVLGDVDLSHVVWMKPTEATLAPTALMLTAEEQDAQRRGGTWTQIFDAADWLNRSPALAVLVWWGLIQVVGLIAFPLLFFTVPGLRDRGWPLTKGLGLLLWATLAWLAASSGLTYSRLTLFFSLLALALAGAGLAWWRRHELSAWVSRERRAILVSELLYSGMFLLFLLIRYGNPDLWHPVMGGERPMDFAYLNAIIKSTRFPPYDPWFSGGVMNYYYFGFVIVGTPIKLLGLLPEIAYNLALPTFFALTGGGAFSIAFNLISGRSALRRDRRLASGVADLAKAALYAGLIAAIFVALLGNLAEIQVVADGLYQLGSQGFAFKSTIPGLEPLVVGLRGLARHVLGGEPMPWRPEWPYWNPSRAIPHPAGEAPPITEFPFFTFLYSDLHPHLLALPLVLLALAYLLNWILDPGFWRLNEGDPNRRRRRWLSAITGLVIGAVVIGSLRPTNTWDYATYLALTPLALIVGYVTHGVGVDRIRWDLETLKRGVRAVGGRFVLLAALSALLFLPYLARYATASTGFELWKGSKTPLWAYLGVHGLFLFPIMTWLILQVLGRKQLSNPPSAASAADPAGQRTVAIVLLLFVTLFAVVAGYSVALVVLPFGFLALIVLLRRDSSPAQRTVALLVGVSLILTLWVEIGVLNYGDVGRMNTVFKFYLQAWVLFGIAAAVCLVWVTRTFRGGEGAPGPPVVAAFSASLESDVDPSQLSGATDRGADDIARAIWPAWKAVLILLLALAALYPILATRAKINDRWAREIGPGLDGIAWMTAVNDTQFDANGVAHTFPLRWDYAALMWLRENVQGSPVVAEGASAPPYRSLRGRVATYTGLPIIIGYPWHQKQQRSFVETDLIGQRERDANNLFTTPDPWAAKEILDRYDVTLVYVGDLERVTYPADGIVKFADMEDLGLLQTVYANEGVTIYKVVR